MWKLTPAGLGRYLYQPLAKAEYDGEGDEEADALPRPLPSARTADELAGKGGGLGAHLLLVFSGLCLAGSLFFYLHRSGNLVTDTSCTHRMSAPSPVLEAVEHEWTTFDNVFRPDMYSGFPANTSEAAWAALWDFGAFSVPVESLAGLNKSSALGDFRLVDSPHGGGVGGLLEGAHQIHCLNLVRQFIYRKSWDYSGLPSFSGGDKTRRAHVDHCIDALRTVFACDGDVTPIAFKRSAITGRAAGKGFPRKCRVYSKMVDWVHSHSVFDTVE